jgi:hypothetical protein
MIVQHARSFAYFALFRAIVVQASRLPAAETAAPQVWRREIHDKRPGDALAIIAVVELPNGAS